MLACPISEDSILLVRSVDTHLFANSANDVTKRVACRTVGEIVKETLAKVASHANAGIKRDCAEERNGHVLSQASGATSSSLEDLALMGALGTDEARHVLYNAEHLDTSLTTEVDLLSHVQETDFLWGGDNNGTVDTRLFEEAVDAEMLVAGARRGVDNEIVQLAPLYILEELFDKAVLLGTTPDNSVVTVGQHELDAHDTQVFGNPDRAPSSVAHMDSLLLYAHHLGDARSTDIGIHDSNLGVGVCGECMA